LITGIPLEVGDGDANLGLNVREAPLISSDMDLAGVE
jgi:hypothetical protein